MISEPYSAYKFGKSASNDLMGAMNHADDKDSDEDSYQGAAMNLLDIRNPNRWDSSSQAENSTEGGYGLHQASEPSRSSDVPIAKVFQPKFLAVFQKYSEQLKTPVDLSKHLMTTCLEQLIGFSSWARESAQRTQWIKTTLEDNADLRPEVRNGLSMILIYCLSAAKASAAEDMFSILQDAESGLGIVNKTSLKIYNDPFTYFNFLKSCISGLIDAGRIPENERQNQPKKAKRSAENKDEVIAFLQLKALLVGALNKGDNVLARARVAQVAQVWHQRAKAIRNHRFATALASLGPQHSKKTSYDEMAASCSPHPSSPPAPTPEEVPPAKCARTAVRCPTAAAIPALRFERVAAREWNVLESRIFSLDSLLASSGGVCCLVDEARLLASTPAHHLVGTASGVASLTAELSARGALVTAWPRQEQAHMRGFLESWLSGDGGGLLGHWQRGAAADGSAASPSVGQGVLAYETVVQVGIVLRACSALGIDEDCWRLVYPRDLQTSTATSSATVAAFLMTFFPQLRAAEEVLGSRTVVVKYFSHVSSAPLLQAPKAEAMGMYQTLGTLADPAVAMLSRFDASAGFHDIVLQMR